MCRGAQGHAPAGFAQALQRRANQRRIPDMPKSAALLKEKGMLPAIWFILSRFGREGLRAR